MEFLLNEDQQMIHDLARDFAQTVLAPRIEEIEAGELVEVSTGEKLPQLLDVPEGRMTLAEFIAGAHNETVHHDFDIVIEVLV